MKKTLYILSLLMLMANIVFGQPLIHNSYTTNNDSSLPSPAMVITNFRAIGINYDTIGLQQLCATPNTRIVLQAGATYYITNRIVVTNNIYIDGNGATLSYSSTATNSMIDTYYNNYNQSFVNINFMGNNISNYANYNGPPYTTSTFNFPPNNPDIIGNSSIRNNNGLRLCLSAGGVVDGCTFRGFAGCGIIAYNMNGDSAYESNQTSVANCNITQCFLGLDDSAGFWDGIPHYGDLFGDNSLNNPTSTDYDAGQYAIFKGLSVTACTFGLNVSAGNAKITHCNVTDCYFGITLGGGKYAQHGLIDACTVNHCIYPLMDGYSDSGETIFNCIFYAELNPIWVYANQGVQFNSDVFSTVPSVLCTNIPNGGANSNTAVSFIGCIAPINNVHSPTNLVQVVSTNAYAYGFGNFDAYGTDDGSMTSGKWMMTNSTGVGNGTFTYTTFAGNGSGLTNLNASSISSGTIAQSYLPLTINSTIVNSSVISSNFVVPITDWGNNGSDFTINTSQGDSPYAFGPTLKMLSSSNGRVHCTCPLPAWVTNAVVTVYISYGNTLPLTWQTYNSATTYLPGGNNTPGGSWSQYFTLQPQTITPVSFTNSWIDTTNLQGVVKILDLWTFNAPTNTANNPCIIKAVVNATGPINEGY